MDIPVTPEGGGEGKGHSLSAWRNWDNIYATHGGGEKTSLNARKKLDNMCLASSGCGRTSFQHFEEMGEHSFIS